MKAEPIPTRSRTIVQKRSHGLCERCGGKGMHWHHRRRRNVRDSHTHCPCNGIYLCSKCHTEVHSEVFTARADGFIISVNDSPSEVPVATYSGMVYLSCNGNIDFHSDA